jgi:2-oxoisovalerate dehydrogenase E1 component
MATAFRPTNEQYAVVKPADKGKGYGMESHIDGNNILRYIIYCGIEKLMIKNHVQFY